MFDEELWTLMNMSHVPDLKNLISLGKYYELQDASFSDNGITLKGAMGDVTVSKELLHM